MFSIVIYSSFPSFPFPLKIKEKITSICYLHVLDFIFLPIFTTGFRRLVLSIVGFVRRNATWPNT